MNHDATQRISDLEELHQGDKLFALFCRSSAAIWQGARTVADLIPGILKKTKVKNPLLGIAVAFAVLISSFAVAIAAFLLIAPVLQIILTLLALLAFAPRILWNLVKNLVNPANRAADGSGTSDEEARVRSAILSMATIGVPVMKNEGFTYAIWSRAMLEDDDIKARLCECGAGDEQACLERVYCLSRGMLIGVYQYKAGTRDYRQWRDGLLDKLDQETRRDMEPYVAEFYHLVDEKEREFAPSRDAEWVLTALIGCAIIRKGK